VIGAALSPLRREWSAVRRRHGLPPVGGDLVSALASPYLYLIPSSLAFDRAASDRPPHVHHVGPCLPRAAAERWEPPFPPGRPLVYATAGTVHNARDFLAPLIEAARGEPYDLFVTVGRNHDPDAWADLPPNVRIERFVPQDLVLAHARAVLCNGGSGAVMGALVAGRPLVLVPLAADQPENARRCVERGVGLLVRARPLRPAAIRQALRQVLGDPGYRDRAASLGSRLAREDGATRASELLEALTRTGKPVPREAHPQAT
jgi:MGT family glycosyltransferase